ncbi:MAG: polynucleotide kinase-phosphatase, partial [Acidobacteria bacterium]|nr:polynucleotide kinase-phosphatase [Acidobacteriota bacterium]
RDPAPVAVLQPLMDAAEHGAARAVPGNHDVKLVRALAGRDVQRGHGLAETMDQVEKTPEAFRERVRDFLNGLPSHYELDGGKLVAVHAGLTEKHHGRTSREVRDFAVYGDTTGETGPDGLPVRRDWARDYRGRTTVVYGHTPADRLDWVNNTLCIDTGCAFGGQLTALRYPEAETVSVDAQEVYCEPPASAGAPAGDAGAPADGRTGQQRSDEVLDMKDLLGPISTRTRLLGSVRVRRENTTAAFETMIRHAIDPRWLIYLPPTMAPCDSSPEGDYLERPKEAFDYFRAREVTEVVCEDKHMGSRAVIVVARDQDAAVKRFGTTNAAAGVIYTRTGRRFFDDPFEQGVLDHVRAALDETGFWDELDTTWACLDCELMPWSAKGRLVADHYQPVAAAAETGLNRAIEVLAQAAGRTPENARLLEAHQEKLRMTRAYDRAYRRYNWPVEKVQDLQLAPFHVLATEAAVHADKPHRWHMDWAAKLACRNEVLVATSHRFVDLSNEVEVAQATEWWETRTGQGAEGMVVKPAGFIQKHSRGLVQPGIKCRGREYLRIIYGPEYPRHMDTLRRRATGAKRKLALQEFALGIDALEKFNDGAPLREVHRRVFSILALETEPIDPRL